MKYDILQSVHREYLLALRTKKTREKAKNFLEAPKICKKQNKILALAVQYQNNYNIKTFAFFHLWQGHTPQPSRLPSDNLSGLGVHLHLQHPHHHDGHVLDRQAEGEALGEAIWQIQLCSQNNTFRECRQHQNCLVKPVVKGGKLLKTIQIA